MNEHIYTVYIANHYPKYEVNLITGQDRVRTSDGWSNWRDITTEGFEFYKGVHPEMLEKRNKIIHII